MLGRFFVITINYKDGLKNDAVQKALGAFDWMRFASNTYYVYSYITNAKALYDLIKPVLDPKDDVLVVEANLANRQGWASKVAVEWLQQART